MNYYSRRPVFIAPHVHVGPVGPIGVSGIGPHIHVGPVTPIGPFSNFLWGFHPYGFGHATPALFMGGPFF
ncbi:hypothetical protein ACQRXC_22035 (plasmid) [Niallia taxi]|uniref:hypothetical protein n=1 Tax=Niallia taxi TaxID=2499688 RepID=UPI003F62AEA9